MIWAMGGEMACFRHREGRRRGTERPAGIEPVLAGLEGQGPATRPRPLGEEEMGCEDRLRKSGASRRETGADDGDRTHDIQLGKLTLCH